MRLPFRRKAVSDRALSALESPDVWGVSFAKQILLYDAFHDYSEIYSRQPAVRIVVDFMANNVAQVGWKAYVKDGNNRPPLEADHALSQLLEKPHLKLTRYELLRDTTVDLLTYGNAYWAKTRPPSNVNKVGMLTWLPADRVTPTGDAWLYPEKYLVRRHSARGTIEISTRPEFSDLEIPASDVIHFRLYNPTDPRKGVSPMETIRMLLAEEYAAQLYRQEFWKNAARIPGFLKRPIEAPEWTETDRERFRAGWQAVFAGTGSGGRTAVLEDGMDFVPVAFDPTQSQWLEGRKFTIEQVARIFGVNPAMVGISQSSNWGVSQYHEMLYRDTLAPFLRMLEERICLDLLPEFPDLRERDVYIEFNIDEKLRGSFEEQADRADKMVGGPVMTVNEYRARLNLPAVEGGDEIYPPARGGTPADLTGGGDTGGGTATAPRSDAKAERFRRERSMREAQAELYASALRDYFDRQSRAVKSRLGAHAKADVATDRWNKELIGTLRPMVEGTVGLFARRTAQRFGGEYDAAKVQHYLDEYTRVGAEKINGATQRALDAEGADPDAVFEIARTSRAAALGMSVATAMSSFGSHEGASQSGAGTKVWSVTSAKSRHPEMDGEEVSINGTFSNGLRWPGDSAGDEGETANCHCMLDFGAAKSRPIEVKVDPQISVNVPESEIKVVPLQEIKVEPTPVHVDARPRPTEKLAIRGSDGRIIGVREKEIDSE